MHPISRALWYIETHFDKALSLDEIAENACVTKYHLLRAFSAATGISIMRYARGRKLSEAAKLLSLGPKDILTIALDSGYGSHEAFTRAFKDAFGATPESVRAQGSHDHLPLMDAIRMNDIIAQPIEPPSFEAGRLMLVAGLCQTYAGSDSGAGIPAQWQKFARYLGQTKGQIGQTTYGVCYNTDDEANMDYLAGVEVRDFASLPPEFTHLRIPPQRYAVFFHAGHVSAIRGTWNSIWNEWLPKSGHCAVDAPLFERYGERFDPASGNGGVELWVPIQNLR